MGGGSKGGSSDPSGMYAALASAQAAQQAYQFGSQELQWAQTQWGQEWPYIQQMANAQISAQNQMNQFSQNQQQFYEQQYQPMEASYNQMAQDWASPSNIALQSGQAAANVNEAVNAQKQSAMTQLEGYGVNPGATRMAGLFAGMGVQGGAAAAGAATQAAQATKMQGMGLISGAINTGRGYPSASAGLTGAGVSAGGTGTQGITSGLQTGSNMMTAPTAWYNAGANNMNVYTNAVNGYNQTQVGFAQANAMESAGLGSALGGIAGMLTMPFMKNFMGEKGGPVGYEDGGNVVAMRSRPNPWSSSPQYNPPVGYQDGGVIPGRYFQAGPTVQQGQLPGQPLPQQPPQGATPGGIITPQMSPSGGQVSDDVDAKLTVGEFVMPLDVVRFKGKEYFYKQIDSARKQEAIQSSRGDIGGEPVSALPSRNPQFVSRPNTMPQGPIPGAIPARAA